MTGKLLRIEPSALGMRFDDGGNTAICQPSCPYAPALGDRPNTGPSVIEAATNQAFRAATGQAIIPRGMAMTWPCPSWSVLLRRMVMRRPSAVSSKSSTFRATSSERRKAPAKPMSSRARSRVPRSTLQDEVHHVIVFGLVLAL